MHPMYGPVCSMGGGAVLKLEALTALSDGTNEICCFARMCMCAERRFRWDWLKERSSVGYVFSIYAPSSLFPHLRSTLLQPARWDETRWDACHCQANLHCSACSSAACSTAGCTGEGRAGPDGHPAWRHLVRDRALLVLRSVCVSASPRRTPSAQLGRNQRRSRKSMFVFFWQSWGCAGLFFLFGSAFLLSPGMDFHGEAPAIRSAQIYLELRFSDPRNFTSRALVWNSSQFGFFSLTSRLLKEMWLKMCSCCPSLQGSWFWLSRLVTVSQTGQKTWESISFQTVSKTQLIHWIIRYYLVRPIPN